MSAWRWRLFDCSGTRVGFGQQLRHRAPEGCEFHSILFAPCPEFLGQSGECISLTTEHRGEIPGSLAAGGLDAEQPLHGGEVVVGD